MSREYLHKPWEKAARRRRLILLVLIFVPTFFACGFMTKTLPHKGAAPLELLLVIFFGVLYAWILVGFWTSVAGFLAIMRHFDRFITTNKEGTSIPSQAR